MNNDRVTIKIEDGVADVRMVRGDKMNALDEPMLHALVDAGEALKTQKSLRTVVLSGEGKAFCAGLDMSIFASVADDKLPFGLDRRDYGEANLFQHAALVWRQIPVPVIAAIHGVAFGAGFQIALGADMRYVAADTKMAIMEIKWGIVPDMAGNALWRDLARADVVRELAYTGRIFSGAEALTYGFATRVCTNPLEEALATAKEIATKNPHAIRANKRLFNLAEHATRADVLREETIEQLRLIRSPNQVEAVMANIEKRPPRFADMD